MKLGVVMLCFETLPFTLLIGVVSGCSLHRRSRFWLRLAGIAVAMLLPDLVLVLAPPPDQSVVVVLWLGLVWGLCLVVPAGFLLFRGENPEPGAGGEGGEGPDPGDDRPTPPAPIGGIPLPDAEQSSVRLRDHRPRRAPRPRRSTRRRERVPS